MCVCVCRGVPGIPLSRLGSEVRLDGTSGTCRRFEPGHSSDGRCLSHGTSLDLGHCVVGRDRRDHQASSQAVVAREQILPHPVIDRGRNRDCEVRVAVRLEPGHAIQDHEPGFGFGQDLLGERFKTSRRGRHRTRICVREAVQPDPASEMYWRQ